MTRHIVTVVVLWAVLTAVGELLVFAPLFPTVGAKSAEEFDKIFRILITIGIPVFMFVIAVLSYSFVRFGSRGAPSEDGPAHRGVGLVPKLWLAITGALAIGVMIYPGMTSLAHLQASGSGMGWGDEDAEIEVNVTAYQFAWDLEYRLADQPAEQPGVKINLATNFGTDDQGEKITPALMLPIDKSVRFNVNSIDVVHSFWIPAFRMKIDAMPGRTTFFTVTPDKLGAYEDDDAYRIQCAELCGMDHSLMRFPVRVVEAAEFDEWITELQAAGG